MREVKDDILRDAIKTSIKYRQEINQLKEVIAILTIIIVALLVCLLVLR